MIAPTTCPHAPDHSHQVMELLLELRADRRLQTSNACLGSVLLGRRLLALRLSLLCYSRHAPKSTK